MLSKRSRAKSSALSLKTLITKKSFQKFSEKESDIMVDIFAVKPHQVSKDLKGYALMFYGEPKSGKTTTAAKFPKSLLLASN